MNKLAVVSALMLVSISLIAGDLSKGQPVANFGKWEIIKLNDAFGGVSCTAAYDKKLQSPIVTR